MTKNLQIALIILVILIGIYLLNRSSQTKFVSTSEAIFNDELEDIFKFLIQQGEEAIELARVDTLWRISGNDTLEIKSRSLDNLFDKVLKVNRGTTISENPEKYGEIKQVEIDSLIPLLIEAVKELSAKVEALEKAK